MGETLQYVRLYKYLGYHVQEHLNHNDTVDILAMSGKRAFGQIISMSYKLKDLGYRTFTTLYKSNILSIATYASGIWGYKDYSQMCTLQNRCWRFHLGTHVFTAVVVTNLEMDIIDIRSVHWIEMVRLKNRIQEMEGDRWQDELGHRHQYRCVGQRGQTSTNICRPNGR